ncbi:MAG: hypothetical protein NTV39_04135 [Candidatus Saccharibacteria bacterium]|nr:hypothetical protein [Candidatus Saccharibacteria bacterium]
MLPYILFAQTTTYYSSDNSATQAAASSSSSDLLSSLAVPIGIGVALVILFVFLGFVFLIRWWLVQSAIFRMEQDLNVIENKLAKIGNDSTQFDDNDEAIDKKDTANEDTRENN